MSFSAAHQATLLGVAGEAIAAGLEPGAREAPAVQASRFDAPLRAVLASFVSLHIEGRLRGCIGALEATQPLVEDVAEHAFAAAFRDPRFPPLTETEFPQIDIHVSVLSPRAPLPFDSETGLLAALRPGVDGLIIEREGTRATFLPAVWRSLAEPAEFLCQLKRKAGIAPDASDYRAWRYTAEEFPAD